LLYPVVALVAALLCTAARSQPANRPPAKRLARPLRLSISFPRSLVHDVSSADSLAHVLKVRGRVPPYASRKYEERTARTGRE
jgi:hypothetical protein